jgi:hypothetical protein
MTLQAIQTASSVVFTLAFLYILVRLDRFAERVSKEYRSVMTLIPKINELERRIKALETRP